MKRSVGVCYKEAMLEKKNRQPVGDFDYDLPPELIAQHPATKRDASRMMVLDREKQRIEHRRVQDLPDLLEPGDRLVLNNTRVLHARVFGHKKTGGKIELLLLRELEEGGLWEALLRASRGPKVGESFFLFDGKVEAHLLEKGEKGKVVIRVEAETPFSELIEKYGVPPLPPYIKRDKQEQEDQTRYQTVFAKETGAVAAPTAGLHFTPELFQSLETREIHKTFLTLHVGIGTFRPVAADYIDEHIMEEERFHLSTASADEINQTKKTGGRIVAVGSTSVRTLESVGREDGFVEGAEGTSGIFIYPPYRFKVVDAMLTNFHLPRSTLLMMVSALAGHDFIREAYREAVKEKYRFFSYGDCMLIL